MHPITKYLEGCLTPSRVVNAELGYGNYTADSFDLIKLGYYYGTVLRNYA